MREPDLQWTLQTRSLLRGEIFLPTTQGEGGLGFKRKQSRFGRVKYNRAQPIAFL